MNFTRESSFAANGTGLRGYIKTTYSNLVSLFGEPEGPSDKVTASWIIQFEDGTIATIYDWKEYATPMGEYEWHIGGKTLKAVHLVTDLINKVSE